LDILDDEAHLNDAVQGLTEIQQHGAFLYPLAAQIFRSQERPDGFFVPMG
jgi:hypothetical protein